MKVGRAERRIRTVVDRGDKTGRDVDRAAKRDRQVGEIAAYADLLDQRRSMVNLSRTVSGLASLRAILADCDSHLPDGFSPPMRVMRSRARQLPWLAKVTTRVAPLRMRTVIS